jgi:hypothetical protein
MCNPSLRASLLAGFLLFTASTLFGEQLPSKDQRRKFDRAAEDQPTGATLHGYSSIQAGRIAASFGWITARLIGRSLSVTTRQITRKHETSMTCAWSGGYYEKASDATFHGFFYREMSFPNSTSPALLIPSWFH